MPTREQMRIAALFGGDTRANFGNWSPPNEQPDQSLSNAYNPLATQQQGSDNAVKALIGETPLFSDSLKSQNTYQDALRRRMNQISGMSDTANATAFAARQAAAQNPIPGGVYTGEDFSKLTPDKRRQIVLNAARGALGTPYSWGGGGSKGASYGIGAGAHTKGFDCSGLVQYAYAQAGFRLPRGGNAQLAVGVRMPISKLQPGDLVGHPGHIAIYAGHGMMYEAPHAGARVRLVPVRSDMFGVHVNY